MLLVQSKKPVRSEVAQQANYRDYRPSLRADFNGCCGYCDDSDVRTDPICFHIDHFAPQKYFKELRLEYSNLVYACRFCNVCKSSHWIGTTHNPSHDGVRGFIDPCSDEYDAHVERDDEGRIVAKSELGAYIIKKLKLNLLRHQLLWRSRRAQALRAEVKALIQANQPLAQTDQNFQLLQNFHDLTELIEDYERSAAG